MDASQRQGMSHLLECSTASDQSRTGRSGKASRARHGRRRSHKSERARCYRRKAKCKPPSSELITDPQEMLRSEIESVKSGSGQADRVKQLETQISELEAEASRLLRALDQVKEAKADGERSMKKKVDDATKEAASHVS